MEKLYCTIFIVDISQNPEEVETITSRIQQLIEDYGGIVKRIDRWGKRRLAYPIRKKTYGYYVEIEFSALSHLNIPKILEQEYRLNDRVLRYLTYVVDKKELIQRAKFGIGKEAAEEVPAPAAVPTEKPKGEKKAPEEKPEEKKVETVPEPETVESAKAETEEVAAEEKAKSSEEATEAPKTESSDEAAETPKTE